MTKIEIDNAHLYNALRAARLFACNDPYRAGCSVALRITRGMFVVEAMNHHAAIRSEDRRKRYEGSDRTIDLPTRTALGKDADNATKDTWKALMSALKAAAKTDSTGLARADIGLAYCNVVVGDTVFTFPRPVEQMGTPPIERVMPKCRDWTVPEHFASRAFSVDPAYLAKVGEAFGYVWGTTVSATVFTETTSDPVLFEGEDVGITVRIVVMPRLGNAYAHGRDAVTTDLRKAWAAWGRDPHRTPKPAHNPYRF